MASVAMTLILKPLIHVVFNRHNDITNVPILTKVLTYSYYIQRLAQINGDEVTFLEI